MLFKVMRSFVADTQTDRQTGRQTDRRQTERQIEKQSRACSSLLVCAQHEPFPERQLIMDDLHEIRLRVNYDLG
uniref:Uncharacterized protein n=1 Tax=Haemonchus contortus TaxID=6289 RepID=A0A7I4Z1Y5_HAECO